MYACFIFWKTLVEMQRVWEKNHQLVQMVVMVVTCSQDPPTCVHICKSQIWIVSKSDFPSSPLRALHTCPEWEIECGRDKKRDKTKIQKERFYFSNWISFLGEMQKNPTRTIWKNTCLFRKNVNILTLNDFLFQIFFQGKNFLCHLAVKSWGISLFTPPFFYNRAQPTFSRTTKSIKSVRPHWNEKQERSSVTKSRKKEKMSVKVNNKN